MQESQTLGSGGLKASFDILMASPLSPKPSPCLIFMFVWFCVLHIVLWEWMCVQMCGVCLHRWGIQVRGQSWVSFYRTLIGFLDVWERVSPCLETCITRLFCHPVPGIHLPPHIQHWESKHIQAHISTSGFFIWPLGMEVRPSSLQGKCSWLSLSLQPIT